MSKFLDYAQSVFTDWAHWVRLDEDMKNFVTNFLDYIQSIFSNCAYWVYLNEYTFFCPKFLDYAQSMFTDWTHWVRLNEYIKNFCHKLSWLCSKHVLGLYLLSILKWVYKFFCYKQHDYAQSILRAYTH